MNEEHPAQPAHDCWERPGGGLAEGEDTAATCRRELAEETGITDVEIGPVVWLRESVFRYREREHHRFDWVHLARLAGERRQARRWTTNEEATVLGERWWTLPELEAAAGVRFLPRRLAALVGRILRGGHDQVVHLYEDTLDPATMALEVVAGRSCSCSSSASSMEIFGAALLLARR